MFKQFRLLLKNRKKEILLGVSGALLVSSFLLQFYIQILLVNPVIGDYVTFITEGSDPAIEVSGLFDFNNFEDNSVLTEIQGDYKNIENDFPTQVKNSKSSVSIWGTKRHLLDTFFQYLDANLSLETFNILDNGKYGEIRETMSEFYNFVYPNDTINQYGNISVEGILFIDDITCNISEYAAENEISDYSSLNMTLIPEMELFNNYTETFRNISIMIVPLSIYNNNTFWSISSYHSGLYDFFSNTMTTSYFSCLVFSESFVDDLELGSFFSKNTDLSYFPIDVKIKLHFIVQKVIDNYINNSRYNNQLNLVSKKILKLLKENDCYNTRISSSYIDVYRDAIQQYQWLFLIIQIIIQLPTLIFVFITFFMFSSDRNSNFRENLLNKLLLKGYSRLWVFLYAMLEFVVVSTGIIVFTSVFSIFIVSIPLMITDWTYFWSVKWSHIQWIFVRLLFNFETKFVILFVLFIGDFTIWKSIITYTPTTITTQKSSDPNLNEFSKRAKFFDSRMVWGITVISSLSAIAITSLFIQENLNNLNEIILTLVIVIQVIATLLIIMLLFVNGGFFVLKRTCLYLQDVHFIFLEIYYFLLSRKNQKLLVSSIVFALVAISAFSTTYNTMIYNGERNANSMQGTDVRILSSISQNNTFLDILENNITEIDKVTVVNRTKNSLGTQFSPVNYINFSIIVIDPEEFFDIAYFEDRFFESKRLEEIKDDFNNNNTALVCSYDKQNILNVTSGTDLLITGYSNESRVVKFQWKFDIVDYFAFWPTLTLNQLKDDRVQLIITTTTFSYLSKKIDFEATSEYWITIKDDYRSQIHDIKFPNPPAMNNIFYKRSETDKDHPFFILMNQLFNNSIYIASFFIILMVVQSYITMLFYDLSSRKHAIGVLRSMGFTKSHSSIGITLNFVLLNLLVIIPLIMSIVALTPIIKMILYFSQSVPLIVYIDVNLLIMLIGILLFSSFIPILLFLPIIKQPIASLLRNYD